MQDNEKPVDRANDPIAWHPAFVEAMQMELDDYKDALEFHPEFQLTAEPLRIDCVVIKKARGVVIEKNIAAIFRDVNLIEYKSTDDYISIEDYYKVYAYAYLYASFERVPITNLTITFIESHYPRNLLAHLEKVLNYQIEETYPGIYSIKEDRLAIQVINSRRLAPEENLWLKNLDRNLKVQEAQRIFSEIEKLKKTVRIEAYLDVIFRANSSVIEEALHMGDDTNARLIQTLKEIGLLDKWEATLEATLEAKWEATLEAKLDSKAEERAKTIAKNLANQGYPLEDIITATGLDPATVTKLSSE